MHDTIDLHLLKEAIEATRSAIIITDHLQNDDPIIYANPAFYALTGYTAKEVIGNNCRFLQGPNTDKKSTDKIRRALSAEKPLRITLLNYKKDGSPFWNDLALSPIKNKEGVVTHFIGLQMDVSDHINYQAILKESQASLTRSNKELEQFTYAASHDLQEPLRMVVSYMQLIKKRYQNQLDEDANTFIEFAVEGAQRMQVLVNDLLLLSRVRTKAVPFKKVEMNEVLEQAIFNLRIPIEENDAKIIHEKLPEIVADQTQMVQLLQNLISNAIKYRKPGVTPIIEIGSNDNGKNITFTIKDNGIGVEKDYHERIFGVFQRLHTRSEYEGNGVGLAICRKIVEQHGGELSVKSTPGKGATFYFSIPKDRKAGQ